MAKSPRNLASDLVRRVLSVARGIIGIESNRDMYSVLGYKAAPEFMDYIAKYYRQDIAGRIIDAPADAIWADPPHITSNDAEWNKLWNDIVVRHNLWAAFSKVDKLAGMGQYATLLIGYAGATSDLKSAVTKVRKTGADGILYLQPYSCASAEIKQVDGDTSTDNFMKPLLYTVNPASLTTSEVYKKQTVGFNFTNGLTTFEVHASRMLHIAENTLENDILGSGRLERVFNLLDDLLKVAGGTAETYWLTANRGLHVDVDKELELSPEDAADLSAEIDEYTDNLRRVIRTRGVKVNSLGSDNPDPRGIFEVLIALIAGATGIPRRILIGSEAGQLASDQDRANWAERVTERRRWAEYVVIYAFIRRLTQAGVLPSPNNLVVTCEWPSAFKLSPLERAQTSAQHARSAANFAKTFDTMANLAKPDPVVPATPAAPGDPNNPAGGSQTGSSSNDTANTNPTTQAAQEPNKGPLKDAQLLITIDEARRFMDLDSPTPVFDSGKDISA